MRFEVVATLDEKTRKMFYDIIEHHLGEEKCSHCAFLCSQILEHSDNYGLTSLGNIDRHIELKDCEHCKNILAEIFAHADPSGENCRRIMMLKRIDEELGKK